MTATQSITETPEWTMEEELMCAKILNQVIKGEEELIRIR